jgi:hypothetical protein
MRIHVAERIAEWPQEVKHFPSKHQVLNSNSSITKKTEPKKSKQSKKKKKKKKKKNPCGQKHKTHEVLVLHLKSVGGHTLD